MEMHIKPETESRLAEFAWQSARASDGLVEDALAAYLAEAAEVREMLDSRYDDIRSGCVNPQTARLSLTVCAGVRTFPSSANLE